MPTVRKANDEILVSTQTDANEFDLLIVEGMVGMGNRDPSHRLSRRWGSVLRL